jgi:hypothetical protein
LRAAGRLSLFPATRHNASVLPLLHTTVLALVFTGCAAAPRTRIPVSDFNERYEIIGRLGLPLGTVTPVIAEVVRGYDLREKQYQGHYLLAIHHVGAQALPGRLVMDFEDRTYEVPRDQFARYEQLHGEKAHQLERNDIPALDAGYVGRNVNLIVYETGSFRGIPPNLPDDWVWQDTDRYLETRLIILKVESAEASG